MRACIDARHRRTEQLRRFARSHGNRADVFWAGEGCGLEARVIGCGDGGGLGLIEIWLVLDGSIVALVSVQRFWVFSFLMEEEGFFLASLMISRFTILQRSDNLVST